MTLDHAPDLINTNEFAALLRVTRHTLSRRHTAGLIPSPVGVTGHKLLWRRDEVREWIDAGMPPRDQWEAIRREQDRRAGKRR